jgi:hypothetical protein
MTSQIRSHHSANRSSHPDRIAPSQRRNDKPIERSHIATRDRLGSARGLKTVGTGQRFLECFEGLQALRRGDVKLRALVLRYQPTKVSLHETTRAVMVAMNVLGAQLKKAG